MPAFFASMAGVAMAMVRGFLTYPDAPKTYEQIFAGVDSSQLVMVTGEQDNVFTPGGGGQPQPWAGINESGSVNKGETKTFESPTIDAGTYNVTMIGSKPTTSSYDCRPYKTGSNESCKLTLAQPSTLNVMVRGYSGTAPFKLVAKKL
jgi:hypothetical protein